jgi:hypothetical protein
MLAFLKYFRRKKLPKKKIANILPESGENRGK